MVLALEKGIVSTSTKALSDLYKDYDSHFKPESLYRARLQELVHYVAEHFGELRKTYLMKPYALHSLFCAAMHNKYGLPGTSEKIGMQPIDVISPNIEQATQGLQALSLAHETKDLAGEFAEYVWGCNGATNREPRRVARIKYLCLALRGNL
jgi:hypothetical protein